MPRLVSKENLGTLACEGLGAALPAPKVRKNEEFAMQCALVAWWAGYCKTVNMPEFLLWHTPNSAVYGGSKENRERMGAMLKRLGQRSGVPDVALMQPRMVRTPNYLGEGESKFITHHGLFIELKAPKGIVSPEQTAILAELQERAYQTAVCRTLEDAQRVIMDYLK